jgi:WD40 repeat protein
MAHAGGVMCTQHGQNGDLVATGGADCAARVWRTATCELMAEVRDWVFFFVCMPIPLFLIMPILLCALMSIFFIFLFFSHCPNSHRTTAPPQLRGHVGPVGALSWSPSGFLIATGSGDETVRVWAVPTGVAGNLVAALARQDSFSFGTRSNLLDDDANPVFAFKTCYFFLVS